MTPPSVFGHLLVSLAKSAMRIAGCLIVMIAGAEYVVFMAMFFLFAELLGVLEELV